MAFTGFVNSFTNSPIQPADVNYLSLSFTASDSYQLEWVFQNPGTSYPFCQFNQLTGTTVGSITLPNALYSSVVQSALFYNQGDEDITIYNYDGTSVGVCEPGVCYYLGNTDNSTSAGNWNVFITLGAGSSSVVASDLIDGTFNGYGEPNAGGLKAYSTYLKINQFIFPYAGTAYVGNSSDLGNVVTWTAGSGTYTLPAASAVANGFISGLQNLSSAGGVISITPQGSDTLNTLDGPYTTASSSPFSMQVYESTYFISDGVSNWYTFCFSSNVEYVIENIGHNLTTSGGSITISSTDAAFQIQTFTGTYLSTVDVTFPATLTQQYFINNTSSTTSILVYIAGETDAAYQYTILPGDRLTTFTDGTHLYNSPNFISDATIYLPDGLVTAPSLTFVNDLTTGLFRQISGTYTDAMGIVQNGSATMYFDSSQNTTLVPLSIPDGATGDPAIFFANSVTTGIYRTTSGTYSGALTLGQLGTDALYITSTGNTTLNSFNKVGGSYLDNSISIYSMMRAYG